MEALEPSSMGEEQFINQQKGLEIRTPRLILRPVREDDGEDLFDIRSRSEVMDWSLTRLTDPDISHTLRNMCRWNKEENLGLAVVEISAPNRFCGTVEFNTSGDRMDLGYLFHPDVWGKGYATEAAQAAIKALWESDELRKLRESAKDELYASTQAGNERSYSVLRKCGFEMIEEFEDEYGKGEGWRLRRVKAT
ncbi:hypothetical protein PRK78_005763 [Emydomyces testavorans]|uniref:N-acetyltransferase domain-containing protein n=1 Tax=Emydomyces testavorans TaxID=2070801 RepID=A0AAF0DLB6_9EURO|nr:hypothetical protein PRK78_005763 [Emydomyces testavorans]